MARPLTKTYDPKCYELAKAFVEDVMAADNLTPQAVEEKSSVLAATIQEAIEQFFLDQADPQNEE